MKIKKISFKISDEKLFGDEDQINSMLNFNDTEIDLDSNDFVKIVETATESTTTESTKMESTKMESTKMESTTTESTTTETFSTVPTTTEPRTTLKPITTNMFDFSGSGGNCP